MADRPPLSAARIHDCLSVLGVRGTEAEGVPRVAALGILLFLVESEALATDRLDLEALREGYVLGIPAGPAAGAQWARLLQARVNRVLTDVAETRIPDFSDDRPAAASETPAVNHLLDAAQALMTSRSSDPDADPRAELRAARAALEHAHSQLQLAQRQIDEAREGLRTLGPS
ncbi:hypothetical protein [Streptomyces sp. A5-4]|uniref:hypothetical protein n=1 Tax=Streptomyces sp. A5-4 TaxID=3384771 RepID=UPI003DA97F42